LNGDQVRNTTFLLRPGGYDPDQVDELLHQAGAELDGRRPVQPLIEEAAFRRRRWLRSGYAVDAVDWFFRDLIRWGEGAELAGSRTDPWRDLPVVSLLSMRGSDDPEWIIYEATRRERALERLSDECKQAWEDFGQQPGQRLWLGRAGKSDRVLRTEDGQPIASVHQRWTGRDISLGGRSITARHLDPSGPERASWPGPPEAIAPWDRASRVRETTTGGNVTALAGVSVLVDETGTPVLYTGARNYKYAADAYIAYPDQRCLRFPVRGPYPATAIMTAVDHAGNKVFRCRACRSLSDTVAPLVAPARTGLDIMVHPDYELTDELALAIVMSEGELQRYFATGH